MKHGHVHIYPQYVEMPSVGWVLSGSKKSLLCMISIMVHGEPRSLLLSNWSSPPLLLGLLCPLTNGAKTQLGLECSLLPLSAVMSALVRPASSCAWQTLVSCTRDAKRKRRERRARYGKGLVRCCMRRQRRGPKWDKCVVEYWYSL